jgi:hypothetical protein
MPNDDGDTLSSYEGLTTNNDGQKDLCVCQLHYITSGHSVKSLILMAIGKKNEAGDALARLYLVGTGRPDVVVKK